MNFLESYLETKTKKKTLSMRLIFILMNIPKEVKNIFVSFGVESGVLGTVETSSPKRELSSISLLMASNVSDAKLKLAKK